MLNRVISRARLSGSSDSAQVYSPSAEPLTRTHSAWLVGFGQVGAKRSDAIQRGLRDRHDGCFAHPTYHSDVDRLLLILPSATYRAPDFMAAARELGVAVTVASERRAAMSAAMGERALTLRLSDPSDAAEAIVARARDTPFAAIVGVDDQGVMAAALASERLGLAHNPPAAVARTRDKAAMRQALARARTYPSRALCCSPRAMTCPPRYAEIGSSLRGQAAVAVGKPGGDPG